MYRFKLLTPEQGASGSGLELKSGIRLLDLALLEPLSRLSVQPESRFVLIALLYTQIIVSSES
jgi:hypothetical protein